MAEPVLSLTDLNKAFGALKVTDEVALDLRPGELHALIGPNGAGKTTLVHQISGVLKPDSGTIRFRGEDITRLEPAERARRGLARTFQITSIIPSLSALENVAFCAQAKAAHPLAFLGRAAADESLNQPARTALASVGLRGRESVIAGALSHGEKRALEIAMAMVTEPAAILLDEPLAGIGREESGRLIDLLSGLRGRYAMLLVEHDMEAVFALADRVSVLVYGRVIASGAPEAVRADRAVREAYLGEEG